MSDNDMIRRGDALAAMEAVWRTMIGGAEVQRKVNAAIRTLPAVTVGVKPQDVLNAAWRDDLGEEGRAMYARILSALSPTEAPHVNETPKSEHDAGNVLTAAQAREAALRLRAYMDRRKRAHGFDQETVHTFDAGTDSEANLTVADLEAILALIGEPRK